MGKDIKSKIVIGTIHTTDTPEFENLLSTLGEMNRDNHFEYVISVCEKCEECGTINDTVKEHTFPKKIWNKRKIVLCDYCFGKNEA